MTNNLDLGKKQTYSCNFRSKHGWKINLYASKRINCDNGAYWLFVPAKKAVIGDIDRIFTRIGASDDLASGRSTLWLKWKKQRRSLITLPIKA